MHDGNLWTQDTSFVNYLAGEFIRRNIIEESKITKKSRYPVKRNAPRLRYFPARIRNTYLFLTHPIWESEIRKSNQRQKNSRSFKPIISHPEYTKFVTDGALKMWRRCIAISPLNTPKNGGEGILALLHKIGSRIELWNYRPIALPNAVYKIRANIITNLPIPIRNAITNGKQCVYNEKRSSMDAILYYKTIRQGR